VSGKQFRFEELDVWQRAVGLAREVYCIAGLLPREERFGLVDQIRRAAVSVSANIAEGSARDTSKDFAHFLNIARGSLFELASHLEVAVQLKLLEPDKISECKQEALEISKMLSGLRRSILEPRSPNLEC